MSLLMDALRRAEEAKRVSSRRTPDTDPLSELSLEEPEALESVKPFRKTLTASESVDTLPIAGETDLALENPPFSPQSTPFASPLRSKTKASETGHHQANERNSVRNVFAVKQTSRSRLPLWSFLTLVAVSTIGLVGYFWWQLQAISSPPVRPTKPSPTPATAVAPSSANLPPPQVAAESLPTAPPVLPPLPAQPMLEAKLPASSPTPVATPARSARMRTEEPLPESANARFLRPTTPRAAADQTLDAAYKAWQGDRLEEARRLYEQVLHGDSRNVDALLGLAAIATRQGQSERAQQWYQRVLEADPSEVTAQAALINLRAQTDGGQSESRLRMLLAGQPESAPLHFSLGNVFARQQRWKDAQQAYFQAYALEPDNADYLFNVAVSLDHLHQDKLAAQYYRMALGAAEKGRGTFDRDQAFRRVTELQP